MHLRYNLFTLAAVGGRVLILDGEPNLYIENMPNEWNNDQLMRIFGQYGNIIQSKISGNNAAFVRFETHSQALEAIDNLHGSQFDDNSHKPLSVRFAACQHKKAKESMNKSRRHGMYQDDNNFLSLSSSSLLSTKSSSNNYPSPSNSHRSNTSCLAPRMSSDSSSKGVPPSSPKGSNEHNLYIKKLPPTYNQLDLKSLFSKYGQISSATIINDSVGVAFVRYRNAKDAKLAIKELNGKQLFKHNKKIVVKYAYSDIDSPSIQIQQKQRNNHKQQYPFNSDTSHTKNPYKRSRDEANDESPEDHMKNDQGHGTSYRSALCYTYYDIKAFERKSQSHSDGYTDDDINGNDNYMEPTEDIESKNGFDVDDIKLKERKSRVEANIARLRQLINEKKKEKFQDVNIEMKDGKKRKDDIDGDAEMAMISGNEKTESIKPATQAEANPDLQPLGVVHHNNNLPMELHANVKLMNKQSLFLDCCQALAHYF